MFLHRFKDARYESLQEPSQGAVIIVEDGSRASANPGELFLRVENGLYSEEGETAVLTPEKCVELAKVLIAHAEKHGYSMVPKKA